MQISIFIQISDYFIFIAIHYSVFKTDIYCLTSFNNCCFTVSATDERSKRRLDPTHFLKEKAIF